MNTLILVKDACNEYRQLRRIEVEGKAQDFIASELDVESEKNPRFVRHVFGNFDVYLDIAVGIPLERIRYFTFDLPISPLPPPRIGYFEPRMISTLWRALYVDGKLGRLSMVEAEKLGFERVERVIDLWRQSPKVAAVKPDDGY